MTAKRQSSDLFVRGWNPLRLGVRQANNGPHQNDVWLYLQGSLLDLVVQTNLNGAVLGQTVFRVRLPRCARQHIKKANTFPPPRSCR